LKNPAKSVAAGSCHAAAGFGAIPPYGSGGFEADPPYGSGGFEADPPYKRGHPRAKHPEPGCGARC